MDHILTSLELSILTVNRSVLSSRWQCDLDNSPFARLYYILSGSGFIHHHGQHFTLEPGHIYLIPPNSRLAYGCSGSIEIYWSHFTADLFGTINMFDYLTCDYRMKPAQTAHTFTRLSQLQSIYQQQRVNAQLMARGILLQLIAPFFTGPANQDSSNVQSQLMRFVPVLEYIDKHLGESLRIPSLAARAGLERAYFTALFAETFGTPPHRYINKRRIEKAQFLLTQTNDKLAFIASELGFNDAFHFSRTFKALTGLSPSQYRQQRHTQSP